VNFIRCVKYITPSAGEKAQTISNNTHKTTFDGDSDLISSISDDGCDGDRDGMCRSDCISGSTFEWTDLGAIFQSQGS
jgi:hypothetical protein